RSARADVGMAGQRGVGRHEVLAGLARERLRDLVLAAVRRPDGSRARLDRLARRADCQLPRAVLLLEGLASASPDGADLGAALHGAGYEEALRRSASSGTRSSGM